MDIRKYLEMGVSLPLGISGENGIESYEFGYGDWASSYGEGVLSINHQRPGDSSPYPVGLTTSGHIAHWDVTAADVQYSGHGRIQVVYAVNGVMKKSMTGTTVIEPSLGENVGADPAIQSYIDTMVEIKDEAYQSMVTAVNAKDVAVQKAQDVLGLTAEATINNNVGIPNVDVAVTQDGDHKKMSFSFENLKGEQGEIGLTPSFSIGEVETLDAGEDATASITGTDEEPILNLGLPLAYPSQAQVNTAIHEATSEIDTAVSDWLDDHPEATTTVQNNTVSDVKLTQEGGILSKLDKVATLSNLYTSADFVSGYYFGSNGAKVASATSYIAERYVRVKPNTEYHFYDVNNHLCEIVTYTSNGEFIERAVNANSPITFTTGANVGFVRCSIFSSNGNVNLSSVILSEGAVSDSTDPTQKIILENDIVETNAIKDKSVTLAKLGDSVAQLITDTSNGLNQIAVNKHSPNLFDVDNEDTLIGAYRGASNNIVQNAIFVCTNLLDVSNISKVYCKQFNADYDYTFLQVLKYDANGDFIERSSINSAIYGGTHEYTVGNEKYVRFNVQYALGSDTATLARSFMLADYDITYYEPYYDPYYSIEGVSIEKTDANNLTITFGDASVKLFYTNNASTGSANWNLGTLKLRGGTLIPAGTDILGPVKINDDTDFIGGVHGDETTNSCYFMIDGYFLTPATVVNKVTGKKLTLVMVSDVFEQGTNTKAFYRVVQVIFEENRMLVTNTFTAAEAVTLKRATNGGLIAAYSDEILAIAFNTAFYNYAPSSAVSIGSNKNTFATLFTKYGSATVRNIIGHESANYSGTLAVFSNEARPRCKVYFDTYVSGSYSISALSKITGTFEYIFN